MQFICWQVVESQSLFQTRPVTQSDVTPLVPHQVAVLVQTPWSFLLLVSHAAPLLCLQANQSPEGGDDVGGGAESSPPVTDSQYGTWETGLRTDDR